MSLSKADLASIAEIVDARIASVAPATRAKSRTKVAKDSRNLDERRADAVGGYCELHDQRFATAGGFAYHMARTDAKGLHPEA